MAAPAPTTRRDFLRGRPIAEAVDRSIRRTAEPATKRQVSVPCQVNANSAVITASRRAMACRFEIVLPVLTPRAVEAATAALDEIDRLEDQMTVYRDTSEVSRINLFAAVTPVPVEPRLFELFESAARLTQETAGAFDIAAGALIKAWGFFRGPKRVPPPDELASMLERVGSRNVVLDRERRTIEFSRPGVELNLGAIGKGYALDRAAELLRRDWGVSSAVLQGGRSSILAIGTPADDRERDADSGWLVGILDPREPSRHIATVRLRDAALGTSGATIQYFEADGRRFGHILDPRTGWPADGGACVSVIAPTAAEADALSTAFFILGPNRTRDYCDRHPEVGAIVVLKDADSDELEVQLVGQPSGLVELNMTDRTSSF